MYTGCRRLESEAQRKGQRLEEVSRRDLVGDAGDCDRVSDGFPPASPD